MSLPETIALTLALFQFLQGLVFLSTATIPRTSRWAEFPFYALIVLLLAGDVVACIAVLFLPMSRGGHPL